ncbi:MAG: hypothetical protein SFV21_00295 [Rhodospirillaceae bacterium]|nr:hypothetical protein [Rhodospirillaceae bacterium]
MPDTKIRGRAAVVALKKQSAAGAWATPTAASDAILVAAPEISYDPTQIQTDEVSQSLDGRAPLIGGMQVGLSFRVYLKGSGVPGVAPEFGPAFEACGLKESITRTDIVATDISATAATGKFASATVLPGALTVGTAIFVSGFAEAANNGEFLVSAVGANDITVTKADGSAHGLVNESAGPSVTIARGIAAVAATAGTTTSLTAQAPWAATDQLYRFMPVLLSGNPATPAFSQIQDYTAGRVATLVDLFGSTLNTSTRASIPANVMYVPATLNLPWLSGKMWVDGKLFQVMDLVGQRASITWQAGGAVMAEIALRGRLYLDESDETLPTAVYDGTRPGVWRSSKFLISRAAASLQTLTLTVENTVVFPPNPNEGEGFDPPIITQRTVNFSADPHMVLVATRTLLKNMRDGTPRTLHARLIGGQAAAAGRRIAAVAPAAYLSSYAPGDQSGLKTENVSGLCDGFDSGIGLAFY